MPGALDRRRFLQLTAGAVACGSLRAAAPPNLVLIISDDHGWHDYGFMGHPHVRTPRLDRLAAECRLFRRGYVAAPLCCPSLASIITGLPAHQHRIVGNDPPRPPESAGMPAGEYQRSAAFRDGREAMCRRLEELDTLPRLLAQRGYLSLQTGKWWQGDYRRGGFTHGMTTGQRHGDAGLVIGRETMQPIDDFIGEAQGAGRPFFVWYAPMLPHQPHNPPERLLERYRGLTPSIHVARYLAMVEWFDETCGQLLDLLDARGVADNTVVAYVTDNGWVQNPDEPAPMRSKQLPYEGGVRTPIMLRHPGVVPDQPGMPACAEDLAPTLLRAAGITPPAAMRGIDLLDLDSLARRNSATGATYLHDLVDLARPASSLRYRWRVSGSLKLFDPYIPDKPAELFDLAADPDELTNLADQRPGDVARIRAELDAWWTPA